jgi:hypothetical protein
MKHFSKINVLGEGYTNPQLLEHQLLVSATYDESLLGIKNVQKSFMTIVATGGELAFKIGDERTRKTAYLQVAGTQEWEAYLQACLDRMTISVGSAESVLSSSFLGAASEPMTEDMMTLGQELGSSFLSETGVRLDAGPDSYMSKRIFLKLAHGLLSGDKRVRELTLTPTEARPGF